MFSKKAIRVIFLFIGIVTFSTVLFAVTASNTVPATKAGEGSSVISGYSVSSIQYVLNSTTPSNIDSVKFALDSTATTVKVRLVSSTSNFYTCTFAASVWTCPTTSPQVTVLAADEFRVIATSN
jgi:hypothetical protein